MCLCVDPSRQLVATGQVGHQPIVFIWESDTAKLRGSYRLPKNTRSVTAIAFNSSSRYLATADLSNEHSVYVHSWEDGTLLWSKTTGGNKIFMIEWSQTEDRFLSVGPKHVYFWDIKGAKKQGSFGAKNA